MSYLEQLHQAHKERIARFNQLPARKKPTLTVVPKEPAGKLVLYAPLELPPVTFNGYAPMLPMLSLIAEYFRVPTVSLLGHMKTKRETQVRQIACVVLRALKPKLTNVRIGQFMGGRDHTTIMHALRVVEFRCRQNPALKQKIAEVTCMCKQLKGPCE